MKKILSLLLAATLTACCLTACSAEENQKTPDTGTLQIVTTIFPAYDWVQNILGDNPAGAEVTMLLDNGVDLHSYQPTADDILKISTCDLFLYVGGESEQWVEDALKEATNQDMIVLNLLESLGDQVKEEEVIEGMQEEDHDHDHAEDSQEEGEDHDHAEDAQEEGEDHDHAEESREEEHDHEEESHGGEYDEHVWLSLRHTSSLVKTIAEAVKTADPAHADTYDSNAEAYRQQLQALDDAYAEALSDVSYKTLLFGDRFPFRYLVDDYGLAYFAAFPGCSAETEASFETVTFLSRKMDELSLPAILTIDGADTRIAETIIRNTQAKNQEILSLNSMQSTTSQDVANGTTYLSVMEQNLEVLKKALQ